LGPRRDQPAFRTSHAKTLALRVRLFEQIFGPPIQEIKSIDDFDGSHKILFKILTGKLTEEEYENMTFSFVDAHDVAEVHIRAAEVEEAGGTRCLISAGTVYAQDLRPSAHVFSAKLFWMTFMHIVVDVANSIEPKPWDGLPKGSPGATKDKGHLGTIQLDQFARLYGFKLHTPVETIRNSLVDFKARGWIQ
jgi:hypothetical protein